MADGERNRLVAEFTGVTDVDAERAQFYLESSGWDLHVALSSFYDTMGDDDGIEAAPEEVLEMPQPSTRSKHTPTGRNISSLSSVRAIENADSNDEEGQAFYAGGSDTSGQQILGPPRKKQTSGDITQGIFDDAKRTPSDNGRFHFFFFFFFFAGYRLGDTEGESSQPLPETLSSRADAPQQPTEVALKFWSNGFSVDNGPLRSFDDPANKQFLDSVRRGEIPQELLRLSRKGEVHVNMEDHRHEEYIPPPKPKLQAFSGAGHKLGSPTPDVQFSHSTEQQASQSSTSTPQPMATSLLDQSQPVTSIQIRLADGTRMVSKFNHSHTVGDIRRFICASRPQMATQNFVLMTTFPNKELSDETEKLSDANLLNAVIVQRFK
ncbi:NSFL1 cofactor p47-like [Stylophora pistillata]|uniref:NSFL1 cofactor p47-like n=1 Tax=Stylophora pistillata TaxID=50429 RepID=UPI000C03DD93|nr:NSFL1 cofactor p47-like [Stylophora pistillata]